MGLFGIGENELEALRIINEPAYTIVYPSGTGDLNSLAYELLQDPEDIKEYLKAAIEDGDIRVIRLACKNIVDASSTPIGL